ncbi:MAG: hypothetical protein ACRD88_01410, partial [Terriglobia bacterium]
MKRLMRDVAPLVVLLLAQSLAAQQSRERDDLQLRNSCRLASQALATGHPHPHDWARDLIGACDESGGAALALLWRSGVPQDRQELGRLVYVTSRLRDQRILDALLRVAADPARPAVVRLSAIRVLISYFSPGTVAELRDLE